MATTLLHEMAHAASFHIMSRRHEDFFEDALVAEAGFDYVSRIFGMLPIIPRLRHLCGAWTQWQNITFLSQKSYPVNRTCRNSKKLSMYPMRYSFDAEYAKRLLSNEWWEGAEDRSVHLIPSFLLNPKNAQLLATTPVSFRRWLELIDSGVLNTSNPRLRPEATTTPLQIRQPTTDTSVYQFDQHHELEGGALFSYPYRFPESTESIRRVFPAHGGIDDVTLRKRFQLPSSPSQVQLYSELVREACRFSDASGRWFLKKKQKSLPVRYFNPPFHLQHRLHRPPASSKATVLETDQPSPPASITASILETDQPSTPASITATVLETNQPSPPASPTATVLEIDHPSTRERVKLRRASLSFPNPAKKIWRAIPVALREILIQALIALMLLIGSIVAVPICLMGCFVCLAAIGAVMEIWLRMSTSWMGRWMR
jgi:hypothetical protein